MLTRLGNFYKAIVKHFSEHEQPRVAVPQDSPAKFTVFENNVAVPSRYISNDIFQKLIENKSSTINVFRANVPYFYSTYKIIFDQDVRIINPNNIDDAHTQEVLQQLENEPYSDFDIYTFNITNASGRKKESVCFTRPIAFFMRQSRKLINNPALQQTEPLYRHCVASDVPIGRGGFSTVFLGRKLRQDPTSNKKIFKQPQPNKQLIIKSDIFLPTLHKPDQHLKHEAELLKRLRYQHCKGVSEFPIGERATKLLNVSRYFEGMELASKIAKRAKDYRCGLKELQIAKKLMQNLEKIHHANIVHRDLKAENIIVNNLKARIIDFNLSKLATEIINTECSGTLEFLSPEAVLKGETTYQSDVYSLGLVLILLFGGRLRLTPEEKQIYAADPTAFCQTLLPKIVQREPSLEGVCEKSDYSPYTQQRIHDLIKKMLCVDSTQRITLRAALNELSDIIRDQPEIMHREAEHMVEKIRKVCSNNNTMLNQLLLLQQNLACKIINYQLMQNMVTPIETIQTTKMELNIELLKLKTMIGIGEFLTTHHIHNFFTTPTNKEADNVALNYYSFLKHADHFNSIVAIHTLLTNADPDLQKCVLKQVNLPSVGALYQFIQENNRKGLDIAGISNGVEKTVYGQSHSSTLSSSRGLSS